MKPQTFNYRLRKYLFHLILTLIIPFGVSVILITLSGSRESGMSFGFGVSLILVNIGFAFYLFPGKAVVAFVSGVAATIVSSLVVFAILSAEFFLSFDFYGFWTALVGYFISSVLTWEIIHWILTSRNGGRAKP